MGVGSSGTSTNNLSLVDQGGRFSVLGNAFANVNPVPEIDRDKRRVTFETKCLVGDTVVVEGEAQLLVPSRPAVAAE